MNTACAIVDMHKSTLTLRAGDDSVIFKAVQENKHEEIRKEKTSSIDLDDELLERKIALLQEGNPNQFILAL